jgi:hypothetical protein
MVAFWKLTFGLPDKPQQQPTVHIYGADQVVAFVGVRVRRRLDDKRPPKNFDDTICAWNTYDWFTRDLNRRRARGRTSISVLEKEP